MISKKQRIPDLFFNEYYKKASSVHTPHFLIKKAIHNGPEGRFAVIVSKKTVKHAVDRNEIKRLIYGFVNPKIQKNLYFIIVKKDFRDLNASVWGDELNKSLL
ncbi:MAG: ribonuclease P protein component [Minisyncoccia bacterium]